MLHYTFNDSKKFLNKQKTHLILSILDKICINTVKILKIKNDLFFDISLVSSNKIFAINKKYRQIAKTTDVISFALNDNKEVFSPLIGDIYVCWSVCLKQTIEYNTTWTRQLSFLIVHGLLHLLGYDHQNKKDEKIMFQLTERILNGIRFI